MRSPTTSATTPSTSRSSGAVTRLRLTNLSSHSVDHPPLLFVSQLRIQRQTDDLRARLLADLEAPRRRKMLVRRMVMGWARVMHQGLDSAIGEGSLKLIASLRTNHEQVP